MSETPRWSPDIWWHDPGEPHPEKFDHSPPEIQSPPVRDTEGDTTSKTPRRFEPLLTYQREVARGLLHSEPWKRRMMKLQEEYYEWHAGRREEKNLSLDNYVDNGGR